MSPRLPLLVLAALPLLPAATCNDLKKLAIPHTTITAVQSVAADATLPDSCHVAATLTPTPDSDIRIEVWLPTPANWNGKLQANGNGGWTGSISPAALARGLSRGYATAMTDTGHQGNRATFALGHPEKLTDFGYRSTHEMTVAAKAIVNAYYSRSPRLSYFMGCSAGGRQALMEAQRFPGDYDGIVAGSPGAWWSGRATQAIWVAQAVHKDEASYIPPAKYAMIHDAVLAACDANDGVKDRVLENPMQCKWDPKALECTGAADSTSCLTPAQVEAARRIYAPVLHRRTHAVIMPGFSRGSELGWATMAGPQPFTIGMDMFRYVVFGNPDWDFRSFDFDQDADRTWKASSALNALDPDLSPFAARGGKLIQYHGWSDPQIAPESSVAYYKSVLDKIGAQKADEFYRLFMVPGMGHCSGGDGTSTFDALAALEQWVEQKQVPKQIPAARIRNGKTDRTRPLCPYPQVAVYKGSGSTDEAINFTCAAP